MSENRTLLVTGSSGLIGSEVVQYFHDRGWWVHGIDNNMRADFFGPQGDTAWNRDRLLAACRRFVHHEQDIRDRVGTSTVVSDVRPDMIVHAAAQPSHDLAASRPYDDFDVNAVGTLNMLESARAYCPDTTFVYLSTNKVYGDRPNTIALKECSSRWDYDDPKYEDGIDETMSIDQSKHSIFGASKAAADVMVQEYGRYFSMKTVCMRGGCLTGPMHSGVELHGFLSYLIKCNVENREYRVFGYKGKQVRDNIHSYDVARCIEMFHERPSIAEVFNLGGGRENSISILEAFEKVAEYTGRQMRYKYIDQNRAGDHICYISNLNHIRAALPGWSITKSLDDIFKEIVDAWQYRKI